MKTCAIPECPALAMSGHATCLPHRDCSLAKALQAHGRTCEDCRRVIRKDDYLWRTPGKSGGWRHVRCEPAMPRLTREQLRDSPKPLLGDLSDDA